MGNQLKGKNWYFRDARSSCFTSLTSPKVRSRKEDVTAKKSEQNFRVQKKEGKGNKSERKFNFVAFCYRNKGKKDINFPQKFCNTSKQRCSRSVQCCALSSSLCPVLCPEFCAQCSVLCPEFCAQCSALSSVLCSEFSALL